MAFVEVKVPDIGDFKDVAVIELLVKPGDTVAVDQSLVTVESDKASMEIPSTAAGVVRELRVGIGDKVSEGSVLLLLESAQPASGSDAAVPEEKAPEPSANRSRLAIENEVASTPAGAPAAPPAAQGTHTAELRVPDIGDFKDVSVIEVFIKTGDTVKAEQSLVTVESDKASMEIPASHAGTVREVRVKLGDKVNIGDVLAIVEVSGAASANPPAPIAGASPAAAAPVAVAAPSPAASAAPSPPPAAAVAGPAPDAAMVSRHEPASVELQRLPHASPSVRKFARELGVPLDEVAGTGPKGRITAEDVQRFTRAVMAGAAQTRAQAAKVPTAAPGAASDGAALGLIPWPKIDFAKFGPIERRELSRIKKISGANLLRNHVMIPAVTNHDDADITELEAFRLQLNKEHEKSGIKVTMLAFLIKACVAALKKFPEFNASLDMATGGDALILKNYWHIGFAADTPNGLVVPVVKDADQKGVLQISKEMSDLAAKAREGKLSPADMSGATFTISSLGGIGGRYFTPIINAPEVAILGVCKSQMTPVWDGAQFQPRLMLPLSLTWDHRVIDGAAAARFNAYLGQILADFRRVLL
ncbi:MAG: dihydrolipoyllysine-residue acetyltransferase [Tibeticola sp.]